MDSTHKLAEYFRKFPGIGPRQAKRFVYHLLSADKNYINELIDLIKEIGKEMKLCECCFRFFNKKGRAASLCEICEDKNRDKNILMVVARDIDLETIEKSGEFSGTYFVLGTNLPFLEKAPEKAIRIRHLFKLVKERNEKNILKEIILAFSLNSEGENTADYVKKYLTSTISNLDAKFSSLGRGLSTGLELEYSDSETIKNSLKNRF